MFFNLFSKTSIFLILFSCSSLKKDDFDSNSAASDSNIKVPDISAKEKKLLEKFQVTSLVKRNEIPKVQSTKKESITNIKKSSKTSPERKVSENAPSKSDSLSLSSNLNSSIMKIDKRVNENNLFPDDYPEELININSKAQKLWEKYSSHHSDGQKIFLNIHYLGMTVGKIMVKNHGKKIINNKEVWHFHARFKSAPFYSSIYELDDTVDTYVTTDHFLSSRYSLIQRETKQNVDDLQLHDRDQLKTFWFYHQKKSDGSMREKKEEKYIPFYSTDPFSVLFFFQGLPLENGDRYEIPLVNKGKVLILKAKVEGRERISTEKGKMKAIRIHATTRYTGETLKSGELYFWFSDDDYRLLVKAQAKIKIGSVTADIVDE